MEIALLVLCVLLLIGFGWLFFEMLKQQGRLLLRIEAVEARLTEADMETRTTPAEGSVTDLAVGTAAPSEGSPLNTLPTAEQSNGDRPRPARPVALKIGDMAPEFSLPDLAGQLVHLSDFRGSATLLLFWRPGCGFCQHMLADLKTWEAECEEEAPSLLVVSSESVADNQAMGLRSPIVLDQASIRAGSLFGVRGTPMAILVDAEGRIASKLAAGAPAVLALAHHGLEKSVAPEFSLPDLAGQLVHLSDFRGNATLLLFWSPSCGFCQGMLADLKAWEANPPIGAPKLLLVSSESVADNQAMGLRSPIVLDQADKSIGKLFGATGTPTAVLVDAEGKTASKLAEGAPAILAQLRLPQEKMATA